MISLMKNLARKLVWNYRRIKNLGVDYKRGLALREYYRYGYKRMHVNAVSFNLRLNLSDRAISGNLLFGDGWEVGESEIITGYVKEGMVCVDAGANIGYFTLLLGKLAGEKGKVYAFEPEPVSRAILEQSIELNGLTNVAVYDCALGASDGMVNLLIPYEHTNGRIGVMNPLGREFVRSIRQRSLDSVILGRHLDFVKIDVEGMTVAVLEGMSGMDKDGTLIMIEVWDVERDRVMDIVASYDMSIFAEFRYKGYSNIFAR